MKIVQAKIETLISAEYNPRELSGKQYDDLKASLSKFGLVDPVLVNTHKDRKNVIIGGHQRVKIWKDLGNDTVPVLHLKLDIDQEKELNVRLNKNSGQFDKQTLSEYFNQEELVEWGFEEWELWVNDDVDYSILEDEDISGEIDSMQANVKKAIQIEFEAEHYEEASQIVRFWREREGYIGGMILEHLKSEKTKLK